MQDTIEATKRYNNKRARLWRQANPEKARAIGRKSAQKRREINPEYGRQAKRNWYWADPEKARLKSRLWYHANKELVASKYKEYSLSPKGIYVHKQASAYYIGIGFNLEEQVFINWFITQPQTCYYCGKSFNEEIPALHRTIDRKDNKQGYSLNNIVLACRSCNARKRQKPEEEFKILIGGKL